jgi:hypothetical protein
MHLVIVLARVQRVEVGDAVDAEDDRLAIDDELLVSVLQRGLDDPEIALGPVVSAPRDQPHAIAGALDPQAVAVILDLVEPLRAGWHVLAERRQAELELGHEPKLGTLDRYRESPSKTSRALIPR